MKMATLAVLGLLATAAYSQSSFEPGRVHPEQEGPTAEEMVPQPSEEQLPEPEPIEIEAAAEEAQPAPSQAEDAPQVQERQESRGSGRPIGMYIVVLVVGIVLLLAPFFVKNEFGGLLFLVGTTAIGFGLFGAVFGGWVGFIGAIIGLAIGILIVWAMAKNQSRQP